MINLYDINVMEQNISDKYSMFKLSKIEEERAQQLMEESITIDVHCHPMKHFYVPDTIDFKEFTEEDVKRVYTNRYFGECVNDVDSLLKTGLTAVFHGLGTARKIFLQHYNSSSPSVWPENLEQYGWYMFDLYKHSEKVIFATKVDDIFRAKKEDKIAIFGHMIPVIEGVLDRINMLYGFGIRMMGLTLHGSNQIGSGSGDFPGEDEGGGLTKFGQRVVERMNDIGMIIDLAHVAKRTVIDAIELSKEPCMFSHNGAAGAFRSNGKCRSDEELQTLAEKGGILAIQSVVNIIAAGPRQGINDVLDHFDYSIDLIGVDHVAIGSDTHFDPNGLYRCIKAGVTKYDLRDPKTIQERLDKLAKDSPYIFGMSSMLQWPNHVRGLVHRGYSDQEIKKLIGENALRLYKKVIG